MTTVKIIELIGLSPKSWHEAVEEALNEGTEILQFTASPPSARRRRR